MPQYLSPGVYVEEKDPGPRPLAGVSTSVAGAVGVTLKGPTRGRPVLVTSVNHFESVFGGAVPEPLDPTVLTDWAESPAEGGRWWQFSASVEGFFANGGQQLFVKRVFAATSTPAAANLGGGLVATLSQDAAEGATAVFLEHLIGIDGGAPGAGTQVTLVRGDTSAVLGQFRVTSYDAVRNWVRLDAALPQDVEAGRDFLEIHARPAQDPVPDAAATVRVAAYARGDWGNELSVQVSPMVGATLPIRADPGQGASVFSRVLTAADKGATALTAVASPGRLDDQTGTPFTALVGDRRMTVTAVAAGAAAGQVVLTVAALPAKVPVGTTIQRLLPANTPAAPGGGAGGGGAGGGGAGGGGAGGGAGGGGAAAVPANIVFVGNAERLYPGAVVELDNGSRKDLTVVERVDGARVTLRDDLAQAYLETDRLRLVEARVRVRHAPAGAPPVEEEFANLRLVRDGSPGSLVEAVTTRSALVEMAAGAAYEESDLTAFPTAPGGGFHSLVDGHDNLGELTVDDFVGRDGGSGNRTGIAALEDVDEIAICLAPGIWSRTVRSALIGHCELLQDRFAIVDMRDGLGIQDALAERELVDTRYAATYYPWLMVRDRVKRRDVPLAPSGHLAGIYALVDDSRGVHKAPANVVIQAINGLQADVTKREQDLLNPSGINALRFFPDRGFRVWGARAMTSDTLWRYINVRRLFIMIRETIQEGTDFVVFEPNDPDLWSRVRLTVSQFLESQRLVGALVGRTPAEAYFVRCDETTMTPEAIQQGLLICEIGIAPSRPAEFVVFRIQQITGQLQPA